MEPAGHDDLVVVACSYNPRLASSGLRKEEAPQLMTAATRTLGHLQKVGLRVELPADHAEVIANLGYSRVLGCVVFDDLSMLHPDEAKSSCNTRAGMLGATLLQMISAADAAKPGILADEGLGARLAQQLSRTARVGAWQPFWPHEFAAGESVLYLLQGCTPEWIVDHAGGQVSDAKMQDMLTSVNEFMKGAVHYNETRKKLYALYLPGFIHPEADGPASKLQRTGSGGRLRVLPTMERIIEELRNKVCHRWWLLAEPSQSARAAAWRAAEARCPNLRVGVAHLFQNLIQQAAEEKLQEEARTNGH